MEDYSVSDIVDDGWELFITQKTPEHVPEDIFCDTGAFDFEGFFEKCENSDLLEIGKVAEMKPQPEPCASTSSGNGKNLKGTLDMQLEKYVPIVEDISSDDER